MASTRIRILCENRAGLPRHILGEHGFSAWIHHRGKKILLDTGQGQTLAPNARALKIDLSTLDHLVISHGHYDHMGGIGQLPRQKRPIPLHAHPDIFIPKYLRPRPGDRPHFVGSPLKPEWMEEKLNLKMELTRVLTQISPGIWFSGEIPRVNDFEPQDSRLLRLSRGEEKMGTKAMETDPMVDDTALLLETHAGPVILTGCAHAGIVNTMEHFSSQLNMDTFHAVIGGTHLEFAPGSKARTALRLTQTMEALDRFQVQHIALSHCTGNKAAAALYNRFKERVAFANAGWTALF